ncbi:MAG TPA: TMEM175 family protein [Thermoplasmata archaeon]|nr:TMEM175 family protein [Thermoplasmata archaeon]
MSPDSPAGKSAKEEALSDTGRILSLTDGIFAFAMTLLVLSLVVPATTCSLNQANCAGASLGSTGSFNNAGFSPTLWHILQGDGGQFFAYVLAFVIISLWWSMHHSIFGFIKRYDSRLLWLNQMFLLGIAVTPFVLGVRSAFSNTAAANELYGGAQAVVGGLLCAIVFYATDGHRLVDPRMSADDIGQQKVRVVFLTVAYAATVPVAFVDVAASQVAFGVILAMLYVIRRRQVRRRSRDSPS